MYQPRPVPVELSAAAQSFLEDELAQVAYWLNLATDQLLPFESSRSSKSLIPLARTITGTNGSSHTGSALRTVLNRVTVPGGLVGSNGNVHVQTVCELDGTPTLNYTYLIEIGAAGFNVNTGSQILQASQTARSFGTGRIVFNQNSQAAQASRRRFGLDLQGSNATNPNDAHTVNTVNDWDIVTSILLNAADTGLTFTEQGLMVIVSPT